MYRGMIYPTPQNYIIAHIETFIKLIAICIYDHVRIKIKSLYFKGVE